MSIIDFYTRVLKGLDVSVTDGYLKLHDGDKEVNFSILVPSYRLNASTTP